MIDDPCHNPCDGRIVGNRRDRPAPSRLGADGDDRGDARNVEQDKCKEGEHRCAREVAAGDQSLPERGLPVGSLLRQVGHADLRRSVRSADNRLCTIGLSCITRCNASGRRRGRLRLAVRCRNLFGIEHAERRDDNLLGRDARQQRHARLPVEPQRREDRFADLADPPEVGVGIVGRPVAAHLLAGIVAQKPDDERSDEDDAAHLAQVLRTAVPHVREGRLPGRQAVGRKLHDEGGLIDREEEAPHEPRRDDSQEDAQQVERHHHQPGIAREEGPGEQDVDRQPGAARHERRDEDGDQAAAAALDRPAGHDGRDVAAEAHDHRDE